MKVQSAALLEYETSTGPWQIRWLTSPTVEQLDSALRRLDGDLFPAIMLYFSQTPDEDDIPDFEILGGHVGYYLRAQKGEGMFHLHHSLAPDELLSVWISDQGAEIPAQQVCRNLDLVIAAAMTFCETGELIQGLSWRAG